MKKLLILLLLFPKAVLALDCQKEAVEQAFPGIEIKDISCDINFFKKFSSSIRPYYYQCKDNRSHTPKPKSDFPQGDCRSIYPASVQLRAQVVLKMYLSNWVSKVIYDYETNRNETLSSETVQILTNDCLLIQQKINDFIKAEMGRQEEFCTSFTTK